MPRNNHQLPITNHQTKKNAHLLVIGHWSLVIPARYPGQALMDIVIAMGIFLILVHAVFSLITVIYETLGYTRTRLSARHLANEKMEVLANMPYANLGTTAGIPNGYIPEYESVNRNGENYQVHTTIIYVDDPFDGTAPADLLPTDYKRVRVEVTWNGIYSSRALPVVIVSDIAPKGIETSAGGGTLSILVIDANAQLVPQAQTHITNSSVTPPIDITLQTNQDGRVILPGAPPCATCYHITTTKTNYSTDRTYGTDELAYPSKRHVTVSAGQLSETTFIIDRTAQLTLQSTHGLAQNFSAYPAVSLRVTGAKTIGTDINGDDVYKFDQTITTNASGSYTFEALEWDSYIVTVPTAQNADIAGTNPFQPFILAPNDSKTFQIALVADTANSLLLAVKNASSSAIASASANLILAPSFTASGSSGLMDKPNFGQVFFGDLNPGIFSFTLSQADYATKSGTITVNGNTTESIILDPK